MKCLDIHVQGPGAVLALGGASPVNAVWAELRKFSSFAYHTVHVALLLYPLLDGPDLRLFRELDR